MAEPPGSGAFHNTYSVADQGPEAFFSCNRSAKAEEPLALELFRIDKLDQNLLPLKLSVINELSQTSWS